MVATCHVKMQLSTWMQVGEGEGEGEAADGEDESEGEGEGQFWVVAAHVGERGPELHAVVERDQMDAHGLTWFVG